ncbi:MAG: hypothetical protein Q9219_002587 [cf. Caloplaca sp. 3 TL-2023]
MFLLPWSSGGRDEKLQSKGADPSPPLWQRSSSTHASLLNRMKRKRGNIDVSADQPPPLKLQTEPRSNIDMLPKINETSNTAIVGQSDHEDRATTKRQKTGQDHPDQIHLQHAHGETQASAGTDVMASSVSLPEPSLETSGSVVKQTDVPSLALLQDKIEAQFSLEILLKHRELRLIDQEIAKCQIALEQLRRCHVIPYPAMSSSWDDMRAIAEGTGRTQETNAQHASPWGVTSGPYTRHYRRWLIPDSAFGDHGIEDLPMSQSTSFSDRSVRASTAGKSSLASQSRAQRGSGSTRLKALPHGYPEPKDDKGPMIVKRSTDGQMVKLVCLDCRRSDFNSAQGFINHCRIAHSRNFQSHDAAAIACGEEVELDPAGGIIGEHSATGKSSAGLVHPLIRSAHIAKSAAPTPPLSFFNPEHPRNLDETRQRTLAESTHNEKTPSRGARLGDVRSPGSDPTFLKPSPQTPHLSALFAKAGRGGDLEEEVNLVTAKVDVDAALSSDDDDVEDQHVVMDDEDSQPLDRSTSHSTRGPVRPSHYPSRTVVSPSRPEHQPFNKPFKVGSGRSKELTGIAPRVNERPSVLLRDTARPDNSEFRLNHDLSPSAVESHQAPSLISDDDDCENSHSECSSTADVAEDLRGHYMGMDFESHDDHATDDLEGPGSSAGAKHLELGTETKGTHPSQRSSAMQSPDAVRYPTVDNERHVSFASPPRRPRKKGGK